MSLRTYGRRINADGSKTWVEVTTSPNGDDTDVWLTTLCQSLFLNLGESPFYASYGIPAKPAVIQQVFPDFYVSQTVQYFRAYFSSLIVARQNSPTPTYKVDVTTKQGSKKVFEVVK